MRLRIVPLLIQSLLLASVAAGGGAHAATRPAAPAEARTNPPIHIAFLWHMHQPIYWPYESVLATEAAGRYSYSVVDIHATRSGPYTSWPKDAVEKGISAGMPHFGAQVSFSGSLIENLDALEAGGIGPFGGWKSPWNSIRAQTTSLGNPRLDLVGFGYHHPLMGLLDSLDLGRQIEAHRARVLNEFGGSYSKGIFPPENAFTPRMVPALKAQGLDWVLVDNIHFDRAASGYPYSTGGNLVEPNRADVRNADPADWVALTGLWAPTQVSGGWGHRPHVVEYRDPATGVSYRMIAVPADRYMGNEDARGGFGALQYDAVMSQLEPYNTDPAHPLLVVLHHDGDNYGGGADSYYHSNFQAFVDWLQANPARFVCTTVEDYLEQYPPDLNDVIHVEPGSWSGADNGDPEFKKWLGDPGSGGYSPDRNSWAVVTAARNIVQTADRIAPAAGGTQTAWHFLLNAEASDYWYWDGSQNGVWDSHPTRAANQAVQAALPVIAGGSDQTGPSVFVPQREPYNPGGTEWTIAQPSTFEVWTYAYDVSGLASVTLRYRVDDDGTLPVSSPANDTYAGGAGVGAWIDVPCTVSDLASTTDPQPLRRAKRYAASISGLTDKLLDYHIVAVDSLGNLTRSPIQHVWVGSGSGGTTTGVTVAPANPTIHEAITVTVHGATQGAHLHWGVNNWAGPVGAYWPPGTVLFNGGPVVETPMTLANADLTLTLGPFDNASQSVSTLDFVLHYADGSWDNHGGADWHVPVSGGATTTPWVMDGAYDSGATLVSSNAGVELRLGWNGSELYVATQAAPGVGKDVFVLVAGARGALTAAPWGKAGQVGSWSAFLANESTNNYSAWTDAQGATAKYAGTVLEGTLNLAGELGSVPASVFVAVGRYVTTDGGALSAQAPAGDANANLEGAEYLEYPLVSAAVEGLAAPREVRLAAPAPNPFGGATRLSFALPRAAEVTLEVLDVNGRRVARPADGRFGAGTHEVRWDAGGLPGGVYFVSLRAGDRTVVRRVVHLR
jgi:hypothetical protein